MTPTEELYTMVQQGKALLMMWRRTSKLNKEQMKQLRRETNQHLEKSSTRILQKELDARTRS